MIGANAIIRSLALSSFVTMAAVACQPATEPAAVTVINVDVATLGLRTQEFAQDTAVAAFYAQRCAEAGVTLKGGTPQAASDAFISRMTANGYSRAQIEDATAAVDTAATGAAAVAYLEARGLAAGAGEEVLCRSARDEIDRGTPVGLLLASA